MPSLPRRAICKTLSYKGIMLLVHFAVGLALTGSWMFGSALALIDLVLGILIYYWHERFWSTRMRFGKEDKDGS
jgi:uncharacterized membrane protein